jgi:F-box interacting protein
VKLKLIRVLTLGTDSWSTIPCLPSQLIGELEVSPRKFVSGTINWAILDKKNDNSRVILSLDLEKESYQEISQPDYGLDEPLLEFHLGVSRDCLCILGQTKTFMGIWVMKNFGNKDSWTKLFNVSFATEFGHDDSIDQFYIFEEDGQLFLDFFGQVHVYNYKNHTTKTPNIQKSPFYFIHL